MDSFNSRLTCHSSAFICIAFPNYIHDMTRVDKFEMQEVRNLILNYSQIQYLTVEYYREINGLVKSIKSIKKLL